MGTMHLSDTVSYLDDIQPHLLTMLYAGVGSGKNHFINQLIAGHTDKRHDGTEVKLDPMYVLLITSRRSKVNELLTEDDLPLDDKVGKWNWFRQRISIPSYIPITHTDKQITLESQYGKQPYYPRSFACTNAFIERYLQYVYHPQDIKTHLWELFDLIVVDESHSLVADASYQSAPFYVDDLIREFCTRHKAAKEDPEHHKAPRCKNLLMMTGSVAPMREYPFPVEPHVINRMDECINVIPANIHFITSAEAKAQLNNQMQHGEKAVYFSNHTSQLDTFLKGTTIDPSAVALSFSKEEGREKLAKDAPDSVKRMEQVEESIAKDNLIPDDIHLWLTTSRNKEGINILNEDIEHLYVESHIQSDIIQMAGRIRCGVKHMYIIVDSQDHYFSSWQDEPYLYRNESSGSVIDGYNNFLKNFYGNVGTKPPFANTEPFAFDTERTCERVAAYVEHVHERAYVRYSYFDNAFHFYNLRDLSICLQTQEHNMFKRAMQAPGHIEAVFQEWFPDSVVHLYISIEEARKQKAAEYLHKLGITHATKRFTCDECTAIRNELNRIYNEDLTSLNSLLKKCLPLKMKRISNDKSNAGYNLYHAVVLNEAS